MIRKLNFLRGSVSISKMFLCSAPFPRLFYHKTINGSTATRSFSTHCFVLLRGGKVTEKVRNGHLIGSTSGRGLFPIISQAIPNLFTPEIVTSIRCAPPPNLVFRLWDQARACGALAQSQHDNKDSRMLGPLRSPYTPSLCGVYQLIRVLPVSEDDPRKILTSS